MKYRTLAGEKVSVLGFGCMRFPLTEEGNAGAIDEEKAIEMLRYAIDNGVNYFDSAYVYHDQKSEGLIAKALKDGYREKVHIATKCPTWQVKCEADFDRILDEQLKRLDTDYIDFYLMHALDKDRVEIIKKFNIIDKLNKAKADGKIRHIGFSFHDNLETFKKIVDLNPAWEFCQIQLNYINTFYQAGLEGLEYAYNHGLNVIIMEPLLGGRLASPPKHVTDVLTDEKTPVEWAMDFLWNRKEVSVLLSGMGAMEQVKANISYADKAEIGMLTEENLEMLRRAKSAYDSKTVIPCTKCAYCMPCPFGLNIPKTFEAYNLTMVSANSDEREKAQAMYAEIETKADKCKKCKKCEQVCPQGIKISDLMSRIPDSF